MKINRRNKPNKLVFNGTKKRLALFNKHVKVTSMTDVGSNDFESLLASYDREIQAKESELEILKAKRGQLVEFARESVKLSNPGSDVDKYKNTGATVAILDALRCVWKSGRGSGQGVTSAQIRDYMLANGFTPTTPGNVFDIAVAVTLRRLAKDGRIVTTALGGRRFYRPSERSLKVGILERARRPGSLNR